MNYFILASSITLFAYLAVKLWQNRKIESAREKSYWEMEHEANNTRRKPLDDLDYITIPFDELPVDILTDDEQVAEYLETLKTLSENPIVNFSCITNTELKLRYGAPNITILSRYDSAYTVLARTLHQWAEKLIKGGYMEEAQTVLEFAVKTRTDVSGTYIKLAEIYMNLGRVDKIGELISIAEELNSSFSKGTVLKLKEMVS